MRYRVLLVVLGLALAGCGGRSAGAIPAPIGAQSHAASLEPLSIAMRLLPQRFQTRSDARIYRASVIGVVDGELEATFVGSSSVARNSSGVTVIDALSGKTFHFSASATIRNLPGAAIIAVPAGQKLPAWGARAGAIAQ